MIEYSPFELFLKNNAVWLMLGTLIVGLYLFIKSIHYRKEYDTDYDDFFFPAVWSGLSTLFFGGAALLSFLCEKEDWVYFAAFLAVWIVALIITIVVLLRGKYLCRKTMESPSAQADITRKELEEKIEKQKREMKIR